VIALVYVSLESGVLSYSVEVRELEKFIAFLPVEKRRKAVEQFYLSAVACKP